MADDNKGLVAAGASLVWRRQRVLWWVFAVNLILSALGTAPTHNKLQEVIGHSLAGQSLTKGFDLGMFFELVRVPESNLFASHGDSLHAGILFFLFMLFVTGGILAVYREDRKLKTGEFFGASGAFFWRFVRLLLFSLIPFGILAGAFAGVNKLSDYIGDRTVSAQTGFYIFLAGAILITLLPCSFACGSTSRKSGRSYRTSTRCGPISGRRWALAGVTYRLCFAFTCASAAWLG